MRRSYRFLLCLLLAAWLASGEGEPWQKKASEEPPQGQGNPALQKVLNDMDKTAQGFHSARASFQWDQYQKVVNDTDTQKGTVYFRRDGEATEMMADISDPTQKYVHYGKGKVEVYEPRIERVTTYNAGKNRGDVESFLVLGFGGGGHELLKSYDVKYLGTENIAGVQTEKLDLTPKSARVRGMVEHIMLWVDPARGVSVAQQIFQPGGDYRLTKYSDIKLNQKISDNVFKLHTTGKTKFVSPQGM